VEVDVFHGLVDGLAEDKMVGWARGAPTEGIFVEE